MNAKAGGAPIAAPVTFADAARAVAFVAFWTAVIALAIAAHDVVPRAQAFARAATAPLGVAALAMASERVAFDEPTPWRAALPALAAAFAAQVAYFLGAATIALIALALAFAAAIVVRTAAGASARPQAVMVVVALLASEFIFAYVDVPVRRVGPLPASALLLAIRFGAASATAAAAFEAARFAQRLADRLKDETVSSLGVVAALAVQIAYFYIDLCANPVLRFANVAAVVVAAVGVAAWPNRETRPSSRLGPLTVVGLLGLAALEFAYFYADHFAGLLVRGTVAGGLLL